MNIVLTEEDIKKYPLMNTSQIIREDHRWEDITYSLGNRVVTMSSLILVHPYKPSMRRVGVGMSICNPKDTYNRLLGAQIARGRAIKNWEEAIDNEQTTIK